MRAYRDRTDHLTRARHEGCSQAIPIDHEQRVVGQYLDAGDVARELSRAFPQAAGRGQVLAGGVIEAKFTGAPIDHDDAAVGQAGCSAHLEEIVAGLFLSPDV
jgi:hypothetical protein